MTISNELTIFTPTYNRKKELKRLYNHLLKQTNKNFTWLIVDDGSIDDTKAIVSEWIDAKKIDIKYFYQENSGKMQAHNKGVLESKTKYFFNIDSDDYPTELCIEILYKIIEKIDTDETLAGAVTYRFMKKDYDYSKYFINDNRIVLRELYNNGFNGETALIFKTKILKDYLFPKIDGEKFMPEGYIYQQINQKYKLLVFDAKIVCGDYQEDGYTNQIKKIRKNNPYSYSLSYLQKYDYFKSKYDYIDFIAYRLLSKRKITKKEFKSHLKEAYLLPLGYLKMLKLKRDFKNIKE